MKVVVANTVGVLSNGHKVVPFPSRWDCDVGANRVFTYYPYELGYLSSLLKERTEHDVHMVDGNLFLHDVEQYSKLLLNECPSHIITECSSLTFEDMTRACLPCKRELNTRLILTGPHGMHNEDAAREAGWDEIIFGEYEMKVLDLLNGEEHIPSPVNLDDLPWPEDHDVQRILYWEASNPMRGMVQVYPTRGCPLACAFCVVPLYYGGHGHSYASHRTRDVEDVCNEIEYLATKYGGYFNGCFFNEETHNANIEWLTSFATQLIDRGLNQYRYDAMCGYWPFTKDSIKLLSEAGYIQLRMGVESISPEVGKAIHKKANMDKLQQVMRWCREYGIRVYGTFQVGALGSTKETDIQTIRQAHRWKDQGLMQVWQCSISCPQPGTPFHKEAKDRGWLRTEDLKYYTGVNAVVSYPNYTADEIEAVHRGKVA